MIRIIAGEFRSRRLKTLPGLALRPTSDRLRETLFNILGTAFEGQVFVDCYAGSGAAGLEALSRGAGQAVFIENSKASLGVLRENIASLGVQRRVRVLEMPAHRALERIQKEAVSPAVIFLDPPYEDAKEYERSLGLLAGLLATPRALIVAEHATRIELPLPDGLQRVRLVRQGDSSLSFLRMAVPG